MIEDSGSWISFGWGKFDKMLIVLFFWNLLLFLTSFQRLHQIILISLHIVDLYWGLELIAPKDINFKTQDFELIFKSFIRVRKLHDPTSLVLLHHAITHLPDHFHVDVTHSQALMVVTDQLVDEGMLGAPRIIFVTVRTTGPVSCVHFLRPEWF